MPGRRGGHLLGPHSVPRRIASAGRSTANVGLRERSSATTSRRVRRALAVVTATALAALVGLQLHRLPTLPVAVWLVSGPALVLFVLIVTRGPTWCLAGLLAANIFGLSQSSVHAGPLNLRVIDLFYVPLVCWAVEMRARRGSRLGRSVGQRQLALWLSALAVSLLPVFIQSSGSVSGPLIGWLRLVQTATLVWLVPYALREAAEVEQFLGFVAFTLTAEISRDVIGALLAHELPKRLGGANGPNTTGLLAVLLVLIALHGPVPRRRLLRAGMIVVGVAGVVMTRSLGSTAALVGALAIFGFQRARAGRPRPASTLLLPIRALLLVVAGVLLASIIKPGGLPNSPGYDSSSTTQRAILATAGLRIFAAHPLTGVGWERSRDVIGDPQLNADLRRIFGNNINPNLFPDSAPIDLHNAYVQILAESGILGFGLLILFAVAASGGISRTLRAARADPRVYVAARCALVLLVAILIWWNDNSLYGAQPESVLAATLLGVIAASYVTTRSSSRAPSNMNAVLDPREAEPVRPSLERRSRVEVPGST
jgi:O-antigen ligase